MKLLLLILSVFTASAADLTLLWDYDPAELGQSNLEFRVYSSTNIATLSTNSPVTVIPGTGTTLRVTMVPARRFWMVTASNILGESLPSNVTATPNPAVNVSNLKLLKP